MKFEYLIGIIGFSLMLGFMSNAVLSMEYFSEPDRYYYDGGQVVNVTFDGSKYQWDYFDGETFKKGETPYKVEIGDQIIIYNVADSLDIPFLYSPRLWRETIHNGNIIESSEHHAPLDMLLASYVGIGIVLLIGIVKYERRKK